MNVTMADVARAAGVSSGLVSRALHGTKGVGTETRTRILATAERLGYEPNSAASRLASKENATLGIFVQDLRNEVYLDMFDGLREVAWRNGRELVLTVGSREDKLTKQALDSLVRARVDVAVVAGILLPDSVMAQYKGRIRLVGVARVIDGFDAVQTDDFLGGTIATEHLIGLGHRSIVHLAATPADGYGARREGHEDAMRQAGLVPRVIFCDQNRSIAAEATHAMLDSAEPPSAVVAHNDQTALGVLDALHARGLRAPDDLSVIGYDNISAGRAPGTNLTTVDLHALDLGRMATEMAIRRSKNPSSEPMIQWSTPELIVRGSTGKHPL